MATAVRTRAPSVGAVIDQLWSLRDQKRKIEAEIKEVNQKIEQVEQQLMERLDKEGLERATGSKASVSTTSTVVADVQDWDAFWQFIIKKKYTHMLQKRVSEPAYRELLEAGVKVPGVSPFTKRKLNLRSLA